MLYADDAGIATQSQASLEKMMMAIVEVCAAFGLIVSEKKTVTMHMRPPTMKAEAVAVEAAGQRYSQVDTFVYLGSTISSVGDVGPEIKRRTATPGTASSSTAGRCTTTHTSQWQTRSVS